MTVQMKLDGVNFDGDLPILVAEPMLNKGSLLLVDSAHPLQPMNTINDSIPNLAKKSLTALINKEASSLSISKNSMGTSKFILELTSKKGIHAAIPTTETGKGWKPTIYINIPSEINAYLTENKDHKYYISQWIMPTRLDATSKRTPFLAITSYDANYLAVFDKTGDLPSGSKRENYYISNADAIAKPTMRAISVNGATVSYQSGFTSQTRILTAGSLNDNWYYTSSGSYPAYILYRVYIEDLSVSGNSFEDVSLKDRELYQKDVLSSTGRYYADTFTDPTTIG